MKKRHRKIREVTSWDLSNLRPADGSKQSDNFRRGPRDMVQETARQPAKATKDRKPVSGATRPWI